MTKIQENTIYNAFITNIEIKQTAVDKQVKITLQVLTSGRPTAITDVVYISPNYKKKINAIYTSLNLPLPTEDEFKADVDARFNRWLNLPFKLTFKKNKNGYMQPYMYVAPNSEVAAKWNSKGFGEKEGKIHNEFMATAQADAIAMSQYVKRFMGGI